MCILCEHELTDGMIQNISFLTFHDLYFGQRSMSLDKINSVLKKHPSNWQYLYGMKY
jgi:hypothetical protein